MIKTIFRFIRQLIGVGYICPQCKYDHSYERLRERKSSENTLSERPCLFRCQEHDIETIKAADKLLELQALITEREGMIAFNKSREMRGESIGYNECAFFVIVDKIRALISDKKGD